MPLYTYKAINETGSQITGEIEADSKESAQELLSLQGNIPESVKEKKSGASQGGSLAGLFEKKVTAGDLILFTKQFRTLLQAGVGILQIFQVLEAQTENKTMKSATAQMGEEIKKGSSLFKVFTSHKKIFPHLYCAMVRAGEESGALPLVLDRLIYIIEHEEKVRNDVKSAVRYPIIVLIFLGVAFLVLLTFVVPKFVSIFENAGLELPLPTQICVFLYTALNTYWMFMLGGTVIGIVGLTQYIKTEQGLYMRDLILMKIPIIGPVFVKSAMSRFSSIFSILQTSGITVLESMRILTDTINNAAITRELENIRDLLEQGRGISQPLSRAKFFTPMVINMVAIGEESGNLDDMLKEVAAHYDAEVEYATKGLSDALGPILMVGLAGVVGFFAMAIFLPMWDLTKMV